MQYTNHNSLQKLEQLDLSGTGYGAWFPSFL